MKLKESMDNCKACFNDIFYDNFHALFNSKINVCSNCIFESNPSFEKFKINGIKALSIFEYSDYIKSKIYQYKKCEDLELNDLFIMPYILELKTIFDGFSIIPIPSFVEDDEKRGYNNVIEIFKKLDLEILNCLKKTENIKQKELDYSKRQEIGKYMTIDDVDLTRKKILLVDDVITTGASMKAAINLIKQKHPKELKILCIAHTNLKKEDFKI